MIAAWERVGAWAVSQQARAVTELGVRRRAANSSAGARSAVFEVEARLGITQYAAEAKTALALGLEDYPVVADALNTGHLDARKAEVLLHEEPGLPVRVRRKIHDDLVPEADTLTVPQLREKIRRAALTADAATAKRRHVEAFGRRHVSIEPAGEPTVPATTSGLSDPAVLVVGGAVGLLVGILVAVGTARPARRA